MSKARSFKTRSRDYEARVHSDQMVLVIARREADPCEQRLNSRPTFFEVAQVRVGKQLLEAKNLTVKRQRDSLNKSQFNLAQGVLTKGELLSMKMMMMSENQSS